MKTNAPTISTLRQMLDILSAEMDTQGVVDLAVVSNVCNNIAMIASDAKTPIPADVFQPGLSETLMRCALSGLCLATAQALHNHSARQSKINGRPGTS